MEMHTHADDSWIFPDDDGVWLKEFRQNTLNLFHDCNDMLILATPPETSDRTAYSYNNDYYDSMNAATKKAQTLVEWVYNLIEMYTISLMGREIKAAEDLMVEVSLALATARQVVYQMEEKVDELKYFVAEFQPPTDDLMASTLENMMLVSKTFKDHTRYGCDRTDFFLNV